MEVKHGLALADQPPLEEASEKIEKMRLLLFDIMFKDKKKK
jgi:hypothetical protein